MRLICSLALASAFAISTIAKADTLNLSTGTATYTYTSPTGSGTAKVVPPFSAGGTTYWTTISGAQWINDTGPTGPNGQASNEGVGTYTYSTIFTVTTSGIFTGSFSSDNQGSVSLFCSGGACGSTSIFSNISNSGPTTYQTVTPLGSYVLAAGTYTLRAAITNASGPNPDPEGLLLSAKVAPTPEPSSLMLLGTGLAGIAGVARRKFFA